MAQFYTVNNFKIEQGLPSNEVYSVFQDSKGMLWFGTDNGIAKFDGYEFNTIKTNDGLIDPVIFGFHEDRRGRLWLRSFSGQLSYISNNKIYLYPYNDKIKDFTGIFLIQSIAYNDSTNDLWFNARNIVRIDRNGHVSSHSYRKNGELEILDIGASKVFAKTGVVVQKILWGNSTLSVEQRDTLQSAVIPVTFEKNIAFLALSHNVYIVTKDSSANKIYTSPHFIISVYKTEDYLWLGTHEGVERISLNNTSDVWSPEFLKGKAVSSILRDNEGGYWFTTLQDGVFYVPNFNIRNYPLPSSKKINALVPVQDGFLYGDEGGNVSMFDTRFFTNEKICSFSSPVRTLFKDSQSKLWIYESNKLTILKDHSPAKAVHISFRYAIIEDKGHRIWTTGAKHLYTFNLSGDTLDHMISNHMRTIFDGDSVIYLTSKIGFFIQNKSSPKIREVKELANKKITTITSLNDSLLALGSRGDGLILFNKRTEECKFFNTASNTHFTNVQAATVLGKSLWLGTENGLIYSDITSLFLDRPAFRHINQQKGLLYNKITHLISTDKDILVLTEKGISLVPLEIVNQQEHLPRFYIKSITVNNARVDSAALSELIYTENNINVSFGYIGFKNNDAIVTRFRLSQEDEWKMTKNRIITFYSLEPKQYNLEMEYSIDDVHWIPVNQTLSFSISPPWWRTWYYQMLMVTVVVLWAFIYYRNRLALNKQKQQYLEMVNQHRQKLLQTEIQTTERERSRIAKDLHDTIGTNLVALKMIINQLLQKHHEPKAEQIELQLQEVIHEIKEIIYNLTPPGVERYGLFLLLKNLIEKLNSISKIKINLSTYGADFKHQGLNLIILRIMQELISNSFKHAKATQINIHVSRFDESINIIYEDNGIGFNYSQENSNGFGLKNIESRIESINGQIIFESGEYGISYTIDIPLSQQ